MQARSTNSPHFGWQSPPNNSANASSGAVLRGTVNIVPGFDALMAVTALFGQIPMHRVSMIRTCLRRPLAESSIRKAIFSVSLPFGP
jgi:hypothetical protein